MPRFILPRLSESRLSAPLPALVLACLLLTGCSATYQGAAHDDLPATLPPAPQQVLPPASWQVESNQDAPAPDPAQGQADAGVSLPVTELVANSWVGQVAEATDIPERVLAAYAGASLRVAQTYPECRLGWNTIAGIGAVETLHGTYRGASTDQDGNVTPKIFGPALDGSPGVMAIEDSDQGELDNDTEWDRAVGPLQFIPSTWDYIGQDGNADGKRDPHHIDDAALTAAVYLCQSQRDMNTDEGWQTGVLAYNRSITYANQVASYATTYAQQAQAASDAETTQSPSPAATTPIS